MRSGTPTPHEVPIQRPGGCLGSTCRLTTNSVGLGRSVWASPARRVRGPFYATDLRGRARGSATTSTRSARASPARRVRGPFMPRMCGACPLQARTDRRGRHRHAASGALSGHGCAGRTRGSAASSTRSAWASPARRVCGPFYATDVRGVRGGAPQFRLDRGRERESTASSTRPGRAPPARRVCGQFRRGCAERARGSTAISTNGGGCVCGEETARMKFHFARRCGEWGSDNILKGRRKRGMESRSLPALLLL